MVDERRFGREGGSPGPRRVRTRAPGVAFVTAHVVPRGEVGVVVLASALEEVRVVGDEHRRDARTPQVVGDRVFPHFDGSPRPPQEVERADQHVVASRHARQRARPVPVESQRPRREPVEVRRRDGLDVGPRSDAGRDPSRPLLRLVEIADRKWRFRLSSRRTTTFCRRCSLRIRPALRRLRAFRVLHALHVELDRQQVPDVERVHRYRSGDEVLFELEDLHAVVLLAPLLRELEQLVHLGARVAQDAEVVVARRLHRLVGFRQEDEVLGAVVVRPARSWSGRTTRRRRPATRTSRRRRPRCRAGCPRRGHHAGTSIPCG